MPTAQEIAGKTRARACGLVQGLGYDAHKLRGATATLPVVAAAHAELSPAPMHDGQILQIDGGVTRLGEVKKPA